jgi:hypothetical protein
MSTQNYGQFRTFLAPQAREALFVKEEPDMWDRHFEVLGDCPKDHARAFHLTAFMTESAIVVLTTVIDRPLGDAIPPVDLAQVPVKPSVWLGFPEGLDHAIDQFIDQLQGCMTYASEHQRERDKDRVLSHFWAGLQASGRVTVVL